MSSTIAFLSGHKDDKDDERQNALSAIREARMIFEEMARRAEISGGSPNALVEDTRNGLEAVEGEAKHANADELDDLVEKAESLARLRAYFCPPKEIVDEGQLAIALTAEWGVPGSIVTRLRESLVPKLADQDVTVARGALRAILQEFDSWKSYADAYDATMQRWAYILSSAIALLSVFAILLLHYSGVIIYGLFAAGAAGGCVSVIARMPPLSLSGEFEVYRRHMVTRIATGAVASMIGCALLAWGLIPISIKDKTFEQVFTACAGDTPCTAVNILILFGVPMLFGFSERALVSFEERILGDSGGNKSK